MIVDFDGKLIVWFFKICNSNNFKGNIYEELSFEFGDQTDVSHSCGATLMGEFWIFGGILNSKRQVFKSYINKEFYHRNILRQAK